MNLILGGGLVALLARDILGPDWTIIPIGRSRYYSYNPPLADNYVVRDDAIAEYMQQFYIVPLLYRVGYSYAGQIIFNPGIALNAYLAKLYMGQTPAHTAAYLSSRIDHFGCGNCMDMYQSLNAKYSVEIAQHNSKYGKPIGIQDQVLKTSSGACLNYDRLVSTVPLYALLEWMGISWISLPSRDVYCYHIRTTSLDFEGATKLLVADPEIDFHMVVMLNKENYIFYSCRRIEFPGRYFIPFMKKFELIAETSVEKSICCGSIPDIPELRSANITCIGSSAVWDDCLDVSSCILRLLKLRESK